MSEGKKRLVKFCDRCSELYSTPGKVCSECVNINTTKVKCSECSKPMEKDDGCYLGPEEQKSNNTPVCYECVKKTRQSRPARYFKL